MIGAVLIGLGIAAAGISTAFADALSLVLAVTLMAAGLVQLSLAVLAVNVRSGLLHLGAAAADMLIGFLLLARPQDVTITLDTLLIVFLLVGGAHRLLRSVWLRPAGWPWLVATAVVAFALAFYLGLGAAGLLHRDLWLIAGCIALDFLMHGVTWIMVSRAPLPAAAARPREVQMPDDIPGAPVPADPAPEPHRQDAHSSPFDEHKKQLDKKFEQLEERQEQEQHRLEQLQHDIERAKQANKDVLPE